MPSPFNLALHEHLLSLGYTHTYHDAEFDDGDAENGPGHWGSPAYDEYQGPDEYAFASENGELHHEPRDLELERWLEEQELERWLEEQD